MSPDEIQDLVDKRDDLESRKSKLLVKKEAAQTTLADIDQQLRDLGVDPESLEEELLRLKKERDEKINAFASAVAEAEAIISTIEERIRNL